jgi:hypothetical protein
MRFHSQSRGQAAVEFAVFLVALVIALMLMIQLAWIGVQKWQFNHFTSYAARSWEVDKKNTSPQSILLTDLGFGMLRWKQSGLVKIMLSTGQGSDSDGHSGVKYKGTAEVWGLFQPWLGGTLSTGLLQFEAFVPMDHEPAETPGTYDNDCSDPCDDNAR